MLAFQITMYWVSVVSAPLFHVNANSRNRTDKPVSSIFISSINHPAEEKKEVMAELLSQVLISEE